ncbi:MAG TPA: hypothetical protein VFC63_17975 [Blastocatellia bacterium]|nr:hypothetical protein [Blastocatellia bacterium]
MFSFGLFINPESERKRATDSHDEYEVEGDDFNEMLAITCLKLANSEQFTFEVKGFGQDPWPVDVRLDMATFLEQITEVLTWLDSGGHEDTELDFYEQGIERKLIFHSEEEKIKINCESRTNWTPSPSEEWLDKATLNSLFSLFLKRFIESVQEFCQDIAETSIFRDWSAQECIRKRIVN